MYRIKKVENMNLTKQLIAITLIALIISGFSLGIILPRVLEKFYERNIYEYLEQPANFIKPDNNKISDDISFIIITNRGSKLISSNLKNMFGNVSADNLINAADNEKGKFNINGQTYYYCWGEIEGAKNLVFTGDTIIKEQEESLLAIIFPTMIITICITILLLYVWSKYIISKINKLKEKTESIITNRYIEAPEFIIDDELNMVNTAIEKVREELKAKEEYKNMIFQNLSHELKTPLSVIESYIEGIQDEIVDEKQALKVISEETKLLGNQVETILQFNKIDYMKDSAEYKEKKTNISEVVNETIEKHKLIRPELKCIIDVDENAMFVGTKEMWVTVFDNIISNFMRYAKTKMEVNVKENIILFKNDGDNIDNSIIDKIFLPYVKGKEGKSGLGLSIVKRTVNVFGYYIIAKNVDDGVIFEIKLQ